jgi:hypothetical protein
MSSRDSDAAAAIARIIVRIRGINVILDSDIAGAVPSRFFVSPDAGGSAKHRERLTQVTHSDHRISTSILEITICDLKARWPSLSPAGLYRTGCRDAFVGSPQPACDLRQHRNHAGFVQVRRLLDSNAELGRRLAELERKYDGQFKAVFDAIRQLMAPPATARRAIGFRKSDSQS